MPVEGALDRQSWWQPSAKQEPTEVLRERHGRNPVTHGGEDVKLR